jgi:cytochrome P450
MNSAALPIAPRTDVFISPYMLHRHPAFWSEPEEFKPERFAGVDAEERHRFAYIPFSVGPRHCIGENMAMFEMLVHVNAMSRRFRLTRAGDEPIELEAQINLRPRSNLMMTVERDDDAQRLWSRCSRATATSIAPSPTSTARTPSGA